MEKVDSMFLRLQNAIMNSSEPKEKESKKNLYYEKVIYDFKKELVEIPIPNHSMILYGATGRGKTLLLNHWNEILGESSFLITEPDLVSDMNEFGFKVKELNWLYRKYILIDECFKQFTYKSMSENAKRNYWSLLEKFIHRKTRPILILTTNHINFEMLTPEIERRWRDLLSVDGKIKAKEIK
jgi:DNA replication protein DnaC